MEEPWLQALTVKVLRKVLDYAAAAIIGTLAVVGGGWALAHLGGNVSTPAWLLATLSAITFIGVVVSLFRAQGRAKVQHRTVQFVEVDESLLSLFPSLVRDRDRQEAVKRLLYAFLRDGTRLFGEDVSRGFILREDEQQRLVVWVAYQMPPESQQRTQFDVSKGSDKGRGIAGETYTDHALRVVHMVERDGGWTAEVFWEVGGKWTRDNTAYYKAFEASRPHPPYRTFVTVPVISASKDCLGVLCFDSMNPHVFDAAGIRQLLVNLSARVAAVAVLYQFLVANDPQPRRKSPRRSS
jgi:hypothetical protein